MFNKISVHTFTDNIIIRVYIKCINFTEHIICIPNIDLYHYPFNGWKVINLPTTATFKMRIKITGGIILFKEFDEKKTLFHPYIGTYNNMTELDVQYI